MRRTDPLILGAGPAGCAAAIALARAGASPLLLDRDRTPGDALCGGFLSWRTLAQLESLGLDHDRLGGQTVDRLRLFAHGSMVQAPLPARAMGLSRRALDTAMRDHAIALGTQFATDTIRTLEGTTAIGQAHEWRCETLFLATGKHDVRGQSRPPC